MKNREVTDGTFQQSRKQDLFPQFQQIQKRLTNM